jgi:hypothetical protein
MACLALNGVNRTIAETKQDAKPSKQTTVAQKTTPPPNPQLGWNLKFPSFVIGAWWGPQTNDVQMQQYKEAGFNVAMIGRYMVTPPEKYSDQFGTAELLQSHLDACQKHGLGAMMDTYTSNDRPWGGQKLPGDGQKGHHACSFEELQWLCQKLGAHPALRGILIEDDFMQNHRPGSTERSKASTQFLRENYPHLLPWLCTAAPWNRGVTKYLAAVGNPVYNPQIYPFAGGADTKVILAYCKDLEAMRQDCKKYNLIMWPMWWADGLKGDSLIRFQIYAALAYGADGYWMFTGRPLWNPRASFATPTEAEAAKSMMYPVIQKANKRALRWAPLLQDSEATEIFSSIVTTNDIAAGKTNTIAGAMLPGAGKRITAMDENVLVGILKKPGQPDMAMVVDVRLSKNFQGLPARKVSLQFDDGVKRLVVVSGDQDPPDLLAKMLRRNQTTIDGNKLTLELEAGEGQLVLLR